MVEEIWPVPVVSVVQTEQSDSKQIPTTDFGSPPMVCAVDFDVHRPEVWLDSLMSQQGELTMDIEILSLEKGSRR